MAAAGKFKRYDKTGLYLFDGTVDWDSNALNLAIFLSTSNANTLSLATPTYGNLTNEHANANGYTTGGKSVTGSVSISGGTTTIDVSDPAVWTASGGSITGRFGVLYVNATVNTVVKPLLGVFLLDATPADVTATDTNTLTVTINASGVYAVTGAQTD